MPSKNPTTSLRLPPPIAHLVKLYAEERKMAHHAALVNLVKIGLERGTLPVNTPAPQPFANIGKLNAKAEAGGPTIIRPKPGALLDKKAKRWRV